MKKLKKRQGKLEARERITYGKEKGRKREKEEMKKRTRKMRKGRKEG